MSFNRSLLLALLVLTARDLSAVQIHASVSSAADINAFFETAKADEYTPFSITGVVQHTLATNGSWVCLRDHTARVFVARGPDTPSVTVGDRIAVSGVAGFSKRGEPFPFVERLSVLGQESTEPTVMLRLDEIDENIHNLAAVQVSGTVVDTFNDEVDSSNSFLLLKDGESTLAVAVPTDILPLPRRRMTDAAIRVRGIFTRCTNGIRKFSSPVIIVTRRADIEIVRPPPEDPFNAPALESRLYLTPRRIAGLGRRTVRGQVIATWGRNRLLVREPEGRVVKVELDENMALPKCNDTCHFVGYPQTDMYRLNLGKALYRHADGIEPTADEPKEVTFRHITDNSFHLPGVDELYHGHLIRIRGTVRSVLKGVGDDITLILDNEGDQVSVDISSNPAITQMAPLGSIVRISGVCLLVTENRHAGNPFPQIKGFVLIPRGPDDVEIIKRPPWWTTGRLFAVLGVILALLGGIVIWNVMLRRMVERRSRELDRERHAHEQTEARAADRNRLAIELHDLISQSLTGATMQIESVGDIFALDQKKALRTLDIAARTLKSCKQELRNCIWDLRNNALDERHFTRAIRKSLELHSGDAEIRIQCDVLRSKLSDNTAHAILCIIRELVANAIHHGKAKSIEIVGTVQGDDLSFSVTDDGCGFDTARRPGIAEGHFGLQGIEERLDKLNGRMTIQSNINEGTSVSIWIKSEC